MSKLKITVIIVSLKEIVEILPNNASSKACSSRGNKKTPRDKAVINKMPIIVSDAKAVLFSIATTIKTAAIKNRSAPQKGLKLKVKASAIPGKAT